MKRISCKKVLGLCFLIVFLSNALYLAGNASMEKESDQQEMNQPTNNKSSSNQLIAIVNLDEGISKSDGVQNYGNELVNTLKEEVKVTGLEDARQGINSGTYGAYIIIPNSFSQKVSMINERPEKSSLTYAIGTGLELVKREKVLEDIVNIYNSFSNHLSQVYTSSIIKEYHEVQDSADEIMKRDKLDMDLLLEINGYDLVEIIEIPDMKEVEDNTSSLDLSENYDANSQEVSNISSAYQTFFDNGQTDFDYIKVDTEEGAKKEASTDENIGKLNEKLNEIAPVKYDDTKKFEEENKKIEKNKAAVTEENGILDSYHKKLKEFNTSVVQQSAKYEYVESQYFNLRKQLVHGIDSDQTTSENQNNVEIQAGDKFIEIDILKDVYLFYTKFQMESVIEKTAEELKRIDGIIVDSVSQNDITGSVSENDTEGSVSDNNIKLEGLPLFPADTSLEEYKNYVKGMVTDIEPLKVESIYPKEDVTSPMVNIDEVNLSEMPEIKAKDIESNIENIIEIARSGRTERNKKYNSLYDEYTGNVTTLKDKLGSVDTAFGEQSSLFSQIRKSVSEYNLSSYIDDDEVNGYLDSMKENNEEITQKVKENNEEYQEYTDAVYEATNENINTLKENIEAGQKESEEKLNKGLEEAKKSRQSNSEKNITILETFSQRLSYTRLGELENKEVYSFIAEPVTLKNLSEPIKTSTMNSKQPLQEGSDSMETNSKLGNISSWALVAIGALVLLGIGYIIVRIVTVKKEEEF